MQARKPDPADIVIIGTGATGGTAAKVLSERGLKVVGLDRGPWLKPKDFSGDEIKYVNRNFLVPDALLNPRTYRQDENSTAELSGFSLLPQMVGGGTVHWAGWFPRPKPSDFFQHSLHGDVPGASLADWPYSYDDLEPFLTKVEWAFGCAGLDGADRNAPYRSRPYPTPPMPPTRFGKTFYRACETLGINAHPIPQAFITQPFKGREPKHLTGFWNLYGDPTQMRSGTATTFIPEAFATGNYELRTECYVKCITVNAKGEAKGVVYLDPDGNEVEQEARIVILAAGAIESARLLFLSATEWHPDGLANSSGLLGKNATFHEYVYATGVFDRQITEPFDGYVGHYLSGGSMDFYETDEKRGHICGSIIGASQVGHPINWMLPGRPIWGEAAKQADRDYFRHSMKIGVCLHDLAVESNRVDLDPTVKDAWGVPVARITHKSHPNDLALARWQLAKNSEILDEAGAKQITAVTHQRCTGNTFHQHGTARMGFDPEKSVLNEWCEAHDVPNLYVIDGSGFPTALGVNPTLTMMAHAWRASEYIADYHAKGRKHRLERPLAVAQ
ncbi:GMC family oxidoreductase [Rhizobium rosettiformans]|uniref:GMC family oxidoreductase n=1 Tax=Rhizobium rosettiformans TaxID=1368430 RepID=UPI002858275A|nr:GMC family oxidoreductase [Rhizobium rosettiformans]MDR7031167.1 choline dehydrogenase-like flavoprotein [Rhizobium rosettiformans]MDR7066732.1 choline dehydrogenase-like flavoprotein [Rhizobium rosettiformans]